MYATGYNPQFLREFEAMQQHHARIPSRHIRMVEAFSFLFFAPQEQESAAIIEQLCVRILEIVHKNKYTITTYRHRGQNQINT